MMKKEHIWVKRTIMKKENSVGQYIIQNLCQMEAQTILRIYSLAIGKMMEKRIIQKQKKSKTNL